MILGGKNHSSTKPFGKIIRPLSFLSNLDSIILVNPAEPYDWLLLHYDNCKYFIKHPIGKSVESADSMWCHVGSY